MLDSYDVRRFMKRQQIPSIAWMVIGSIATVVAAASSHQLNFNFDLLTHLWICTAVSLAIVAPHYNRVDKTGPGAPWNWFDHAPAGIAGLFLLDAAIHLGILAHWYYERFGFHLP